MGLCASNEPRQELDPSPRDAAGPTRVVVRPTSGGVCYTIYIRPKSNQVAFVDETGDITYSGHIRDAAGTCWVSFPGRFAAGWDALVRNHHNDSVACVFLCGKESNLGKHLPDPRHPGQCYCHRIYGPRDFKSLGYLVEIKKPYTEEQVQKEQEKARLTGAVVCLEDVSKEEREDLEDCARDQWIRAKGAAAWGCAWYGPWLQNVKRAVKKKQRLKAVFFPNQTNVRIPTMRELSKPETDLWDGKTGGSQKCELATIEEFKQQEGKAWEYDRVDVMDFLNAAFPVGCQVDAKPKVDANEEADAKPKPRVDAKDEWRRGNVIALRGSTWTVRSRKTGEKFDSEHVRHTCDSMEQLFSEVNPGEWQKFLRTFETALPPNIAVLDQPRVGKQLPDGVSSLALTVLAQSIIDFQELRDDVLEGRLDTQMNLALIDFHRLWDDALEGNLDTEMNAAPPPWKPMQVDKSMFLELYEEGLLSFETMTQHQQEKLNELEHHSKVHLSAPAGAGKTFVAVQRVLNVLEDPSAQVAYVARTEALALHLVRWLLVRRGVQTRSGPCNRHDLEEVLTRVVCSWEPFKDGPWRAALDGKRIIWRAADTGAVGEAFTLAVFDELHTYLDQLDWLYTRINAKQVLYLTDEGQAAVLGRSLEFKGFREVRLTEVVRSTGNIVDASAAFQMRPGVSSLRTRRGSALKAFIFPMSGATAMQQYCHHIISALYHVMRSFPSAQLDHRLALLVPHADFLSELEPELKKALAAEIPHRPFRLVRFQDSLRTVPAGQLKLEGARRAPAAWTRWLCDTASSSASAVPAEECIILDTVAASDGLEQLVVLCVGLDSPIKRDASDLDTRARIYKAITRAALLAIIVNELVPGGWLQFICASSFRQDVWDSFSPSAAAAIDSAARQVRTTSTSKRSQAATATSGVDSDAASTESDLPSSKGGARPTEEPAADMNPWVSGIWDNEDFGIKVPAHEVQFFPVQTSSANREASQSRPGYISLRHTEGEVRDSMRRAHQILLARGHDVFMVGTAAFSNPAETLVKMRRENGVVIAAVTHDYGEDTGSTMSIMSTHDELRYCIENSVSILPLRFSDQYPPEPANDPEGRAAVVLAFALPPDRRYEDCRGKTAEDIAEIIAEELSRA